MVDQTTDLDGGRTLGSYVVATKVLGDDFVPAGEISFKFKVQGIPRAETLGAETELVNQRMELLTASQAFDYEPEDVVRAFQAQHPDASQVWLSAPSTAGPDAAALEEVESVHDGSGQIASSIIGHWGPLEWVAGKGIRYRSGKIGFAWNAAPPYIGATHLIDYTAVRL